MKDKLLNFKAPADLIHEFKVYAVVNGMKISEAGIEAIKEYLENHKDDKIKEEDNGNTK